MKLFLLLLIGIITNSSYMLSQTIYKYKAESITGEIIDFSTFKGKKILIVNTASKCGLTPQYEELEKLYQTYKDKNFIIIGFPANDFMHQEPGSNKEIESFCQKNYGVSFLMMSKVSVKGKEMCDIYKFLTQKALNGKEDSNVKWNFHKYLINENGELIKNLDPQTSPLDKEIINWITN